jgi:hypothetical protein
VNILVPQLFGVFTQKILNKRQISMVTKVLEALRNFFHGDGGEFGLSLEIIETEKYHELLDLLQLYLKGLDRVKQSYERSLRYKKEKELYLRLARLLSNGDNDSEWMNEQLKKRRELVL